MKSLKLSLALVASLGLCSTALAGHEGCGGCGADPCCGHGLLSKLKLHRCDPCCEAPKACAQPCDPCGGHRLSGMLKCIRLPKFHGCCDSAPKCCEPKPCAPKICRPRCERKCDPCGSGCGIGSRLRGLFSHGCCETPQPLCDPCDSCGHKFSLHRLFGNRCCPCNGTVTEAPAAAPAAPAPAPAPAPRPMGAGANSNGLLILTPAG
jgi:hypothetical protein